MCFNYFMFKIHVFDNVKPNIWRYIASYAVNYVVSFSFLWVFHLFVQSPYLAGFLAMGAASVVNYVLLKVFVFRRPSEQ